MKRSVARRLSALALSFALSSATAFAVTSDDPPAAPEAIAPFAASVGAGVAATWIEPAAPGKGASRVRFARHDGKSWSAPVTIVESGALLANWADTPGVVESGDGSLVSWWLQTIGGESHAYGIRLARSTDAGASWSELGWLQDDSSASEHGFVSAVAEGKAARFFWLDGRAMPGGGAMSLRSASVGAAIAPSTLVDGSVCDCCATSAARLEASTLAVYRDRTEHEIRDIRAVRGTPERWSESAVADDRWKIAGCPVNGPAVVAAAERVVVAWFTGASEQPRVSVASSSDGGASFSAATVVDAEKPLGRVALAPLAPHAPHGSGDAALAWYGRSGDVAELRLLRVSFRANAAPSLSTRLALAKTNGGRRSGVPRLARLGDGRLLVLWTEAGGEGPTRLRAVTVTPAELPAS